MYTVTKDELRHSNFECYTIHIPSSVIFLGTSAFAVPTLHALKEDPRFTLDHVITQPDRPAGRKQILTPSPVKIEAQKLGISILQPEKINSLFSLGCSPPPRPDFLVVVSYGQILSQEILDFPLAAAVNLHASLLPLLRGASPLQNAILNGMKETGVTLQKMVYELDAGPILGQTSYTLREDETFTSLHDTLAKIGATLTIETLSKPLKPMKQNHAHATFCKKLTKEDGAADPKNMTAETIDRMVRGLTPWPGVVVGGNKILETSLTPSPESLSLACSEGTTLYVRRIQPPSGKPMTGKAFSIGHPLPSV